MAHSALHGHTPETVVVHLDCNTHAGSILSVLEQGGWAADAAPCYGLYQKIAFCTKASGLSWFQCGFY